MANTSECPKWIARAAGVLVLCIGLLVLLGWSLEIDTLKTVIKGWPSMVPATALTLALAGLSLLLVTGKSTRAVAQSCAMFVALAGLLRLCFHMAGWHAGWDYLGFRIQAGSPPGSMSPAGAFDLFLLGSALLLAPRKRAFGLFQTLVMISGLVAWLGFSRYFYGGQPLSPLANMAAHSSVALLVLSAGILCVRTDGGLVGLLVADSAGGTIARRLLPPAMILPFVSGWLRLQVQHWGWLGPEAALTIFSLVNVMILGGLVWATAAVLDRVDKKRKLAEQMNARFAAIVESSDDAIISKTLDGIVTSWNPGAEKLFGYKAREMIGNSMLTLIPPDRADEEPDILARIARGEHIDHFETVRIRKSGERVEISATISPIVDENGNILGASKIARDITERKLAGKKTAWLASFPARNPNPIIEIDSERWTICYTNPAAAGLFPDLESRGIRHPWLAGLENAAAPLVHGSKEVARREIMAGKSCYSQTISYVPETKRLRVYGADITERKTAEEKTHEQLERLALLHQITRAISERQDLESIFKVVVQNVEDKLPLDFCCLCLLDPTGNELIVGAIGAKGRSEAAESDITEQSRIPADQNGLGRCIQGQLIHEPDISNAGFPFKRTLTGAGLRSLVMAPLLVESRVFGVLVAARRVARSFSSGECEFLRQLSEHVALASHQAQLYEALQKAYNDLRQTQQAVMQQERLSALGQMASGIAHDINNAISPVSLYTESLLENERNLGERARNYLTTIQHSIEDVAATVARMKEFYRQREPQLEVTPLIIGQLLKQVADLTPARWSNMAQRQGAVITLAMEVAPDLPPIIGVASEIREALTNLILNAADAMPDGGVLGLKAHSLEKLDGVSGQSAVTVEVSDTGIGMNENTRRHCLEPFFTTKGERGTGLGLAMVYGVLQRHNAGIEIESAPGKGTTVRLDFPVQSPTPQHESPLVPEAEWVVPRRLRLLAVDDDPVVIESLRHILEDDGHLVTSANDGREGIAAFTAALQRNEPFAAVITDLGMPYVDGRQVAGAVKKLSPGTPVILLTGWGRQLVSDSEVPVQVDRVLSKPPRLRELRRALASCFPQPAITTK